MPYKCCYILFISEARRSTGNVIVYEVNGQLRLRRKPIAYKDCKSPEQLLYRQRFKSVTGFYHLLDKPLYLAWKRMTAGTNLTAYNLFVKHNIRNFAGSGEVADYVGLKVCHGNLPLSKEINGSISSDGKVSLVWQYQSNSAESPYELLRVVLYEPQKKKLPRVYLWEEVAVWRKVGFAEFCLPEEVQGEIHLFVTFWSEYMDECSDSSYIGSWKKEG